MENLFIPKYCDSGSILLINRAGTLKKLYCPFRVVSLVDENGLVKGIHIWVEEVATNSKDELLYIILGVPYKHSNFHIKAKF